MRRIFKNRLYSCLLLVSMMSFFNTAFTYAGSCIHREDTFDDYDNRVKQRSINNLPSQYYLLSYSWSPRYCQSVSEMSKQAGQRNFLQCGSDRSFGYILHGLWPQGNVDNKRGYPRACKGDQEKIPRATLEPYLCMTPSVWLLQHEYEYHGTCMANEELNTPNGYFDTAKMLHDQLVLPLHELPANKNGYQWWFENNSHLVEGAIKFSEKAKEWQLCFDNQFKSFACPRSGSRKKFSDNDKVALFAGKQDSDCIVKGNISRQSKRRLYFVSSHPNYQNVKISFNQGERCFKSEQEALNAGWVKANR